MTDKILIDRAVVEQALEALDALAYWDGAIAKPAIDALRQSLEADTTPCVCCGDGNSRLSVTRICDACGSEYAGQAEMDMAKQPAQQPLTEEQIKTAFLNVDLFEEGDELLGYEVDITRAIEAMHGIGGEA